MAAAGQLLSGAVRLMQMAISERGALPRWLGMAIDLNGRGGEDCFEGAIPGCRGDAGHGPERCAQTERRHAE